MSVANVEDLKKKKSSGTAALTGNDEGSMKQEGGGRMEDLERILGLDNVGLQKSQICFWDNNN